MQTQSLVPGFFTTRIKVGFALIVVGMLMLAWSVFLTVGYGITSGSSYGPTLFILMLIGTVIAVIGTIILA